MSGLLADLAGGLERLRAEGRLRGLVPATQLPGSRIVVRGREYLNLAGNDYLGLAGNAELAREFWAELAEEPLSGALGSAGSRLMTGNSEDCARFEEELAAYYGSEAALFFNSGYHINIGVLPALAEKDDLILADKLCHASLIDGMRLTRAKTLRYPHLDYEAAGRILARERANHRRVFLASESVFSMDGDCADLRELVRLKRRWDAALYLDEAHGVGIRGASGRGLAEEQGALADIDILVGACGKAWGGMGAFLPGSRILVDWLVNSARPQIFSTGLPPVNLRWLRFVLRRLPGMRAERERVARLADWLRGALREAGVATLGASNIVPVLIGDAARAVAVAERLREAGFWAAAVRPPTVPQGTSRLRLSLNAAMSREVLAPLPGLIAEALARGPRLSLAPPPPFR